MTGPIPTLRDAAHDAARLRYRHWLSCSDPTECRILDAQVTDAIARAVLEHLKQQIEGLIQVAEHDDDPVRIEAYKDVLSDISEGEASLMTSLTRRT